MNFNHVAEVGELVEFTGHVEIAVRSRFYPEFPRAEWYGLYLIKNKSFPIWATPTLGLNHKTDILKC